MFGEVKKKNIQTIVEHEDTGTGPFTLSGNLNEIANDILVNFPWAFRKTLSLVVLFHNTCPSHLYSIIA